MFMIKKGAYLFALTTPLFFTSCDSSDGNVNNGTNSVLQSIRTVSSENYRDEEDKEIIFRIKEKCGSQDNGLMILSGGYDADDDGFLDFEEAETSSVLCNGQDGQIVANTTDLFQDEIFKQCGNGNGLAFSVAYDKDHNGKLTENEITKNNYRIICETQNAMFNFKHYDYYSVLDITSGQTTTHLNFYYPVITEIPQSDALTCEGNGGIRIELFRDKDVNGTYVPALDVNKTVCNGKDGQTPVIEKIDANLTAASNAQCEQTGGIKLYFEETGQAEYICNGEKGSFGDELNLTLQKDTNGSLYVYNGTDKISEDISSQIATSLDIQHTIIKKEDSSACPNGEINVLTYLDKNYDHKLNSDEVITESITFCAAEPISEEALKVTATINPDTNLSVKFSFNRLVNPVTVSQNTVHFICSSQSETDIDVNINIDYKVDLDVDGAREFNLTYTKDDLPQPSSSSVNCKLKIDKFIEDVNGISMQTSFHQDYNFTVQ